MKILILTLIRMIAKTESGRLEIQKILHDQVSNEYNEQTTFGNVYNSNIEFIMANDFVKKLVLEKDEASLAMIKSGLNTSFDDAIEFIKNDNAKHVYNFNYDTTKN